MSKRANGEGSLRKRPNGTWEARILIDGVRHSVYGQTQADVRKRLKDLQDARDQGIDLRSAQMTVEKWLAIWMQDYRNSIKPSTLHMYDNYIRIYILPAIGDITLAKLTAADIQQMYNNAMARGLSAKTIKNIHGILHKALDQAIKLAYIPRNVCEGCDLPKVQRREMTTITDDLLPKFLSAIQNDPYRDFMFVAIFTGLRESEMIGLSWDCIDFDRQQIRVYRQLYKERIQGGGGEYIFSPLKNGKERTLSAIPAVLDVLAHVKQEQEYMRRLIGDKWSNPDNLVFTNAYGEHLAATTVYKHLKKIASEIGCDECRFHDLRHTYATLSIEAGNDIKTVSASLGHATTAFTMDVYGHVSQQMQRNSVERMQNYLDSKL